MDDPVERIETMNKHITEAYDEAEKCLRTNYHGIKAVTKALLPLLQSSSHGRIVNISSYYGLLRVNGQRIAILHVILQNRLIKCNNICICKQKIVQNTSIVQTNDNSILLSFSVEMN
jgi:NAD(P)-dependent dehydrogenase (short-subunit alcohol dehydrogenase family)